MLLLSNLPPIKARYFTIVFQARPLSGSIKLPYAEGGDSACFTCPWDNLCLFRAAVCFDSPRDTLGQIRHNLDPETKVVGRVQENHRHTS